MGAWRTVKKVILVIDALLLLALAVYFIAYVLEKNTVEEPSRPGDHIDYSALIPEPTAERPFIVQDTAVMQTGKPVISVVAGYFNAGSEYLRVKGGIPQNEGYVIVCTDGQQPYSLQLASPDVSVGSGNAVKFVMVLKDAVGIAPTTLTCTLPIYDSIAGGLLASGNFTLVITA